jgi:indole-3-glycerol phosphate synthase
MTDPTANPGNGAAESPSADGLAPIGADLLVTIVAATRRIVEVRMESTPIAELERRASDRAGLARSLRSALATSGGPNVIAECKRRSPSKGILRADYDPVSIARAYALNGAAAISVLTEPTFFDGSLDHLRAVRAAVDLPLLRKDFMVSDYQLLEAKAAGADAVLLIVAALGPAELKGLHERATGLGLDVLVEVHDAEELAMALDAGASLVGVNNRNLRTLEVNPAVSHLLIAQIPREVVSVSESGIRTSEDLQKLGALGYRGFLVGERFMTASDPGAALSQLLGRSGSLSDSRSVAPCS